MSAPTSEGNPWVSMADLLLKNISVATLATAIEKFGIQTYDRFGRRIEATSDGSDITRSKGQALDFLAGYLAEQSEGAEVGSYPPLSDPDPFLEHESRLAKFGWPADESPDFAKISTERLPEFLKPKKRDIDSPVPTRQRRTYLSIIASLCKSCGINYQDRGASQRIKEATEKFGLSVDDGTIQAILKEIPEALDARSK